MRGISLHVLLILSDYKEVVIGLGRYVHVCHWPETVVGCSEHNRDTLL